MKKRTSNYLVKILFILLAAIPFGCQQDELIKEEHQGRKKSTYKRNKISYTEYLNSIKELKGFDDKYISNNNKNGGFITAIDTTNIIAYTNEDLTTYTFKVYTTTDNFTNSTNRLVKSKDGQVDTYLIRYIPSSTYRSNLRNSTDGKIEYDGYAQLLGEDGQLIFEQKIINGNSINQSTGCVPHILGEGGYWLCAANNKHSPEPCPVTCNNCDNDFTWVPFQVSILNGCNGGGGNNNNGDSSDNDTNNNGGGGGSGNNDNDNNDNNNNNNNDSSNAPDLPTEPVLGGGEDIPIEDYFNDYLCEPMSQNEINWAYDNHNEATIIWNYIFNNINPQNGECANVDFEEQIIIDSNVPDCVKNIIYDLKADDEFIDLGDMPDSVKQELNLSGFILDIFANSDLYNLTFKVENLEPNAQGEIKNADTDAVRDPDNPLNINFVITLDESYVENATDLAITRSIIHESLHAYISFIYQTEMFNELSNTLRNLLDESGYEMNPAQHNLMTQRFINNIGNSLENWDNSALSNNQYYNYLSWSGGMLTTPAFEALEEAYQQAIIDANIAEGQAGPDGESTNDAQGEQNCN